MRNTSFEYKCFYALLYLQRFIVVDLGCDRRCRGDPYWQPWDALFVSMFDVRFDGPSLQEELPRAYVDRGN